MVRFHIMFIFWWLMEKMIVLLYKVLQKHSCFYTYIIIIQE